MAALDQPETISWNEVSRQYRKHLFLKGRANRKRPAFDLTTAQHVVEQQNGELSLQERLRCRIRYFTDGVILGSQCFVESPFDRLRQKLGYRRRQGATSLKALGSPGLWVFRDPRVGRLLGQSRRTIGNKRDSCANFLVRDRVLARRFRLEIKCLLLKK